MGPARLRASFRDPSGFLFERDGVLYRHVDRCYADHYDRLIGSGLYRAVADGGLLVPHEEVDPALSPAPGLAHRVLRPERLAFVSHPYEWSFGQLRDAALLTLELAERALSHDLMLKDASAYNVQFRDGRPVLIDTLSFETYVEGQPWVAYGQFCRHFLGPLALMAYRHVDLGRLLRVYIDGVPLEVSSRLLPARTRLRPGLLAHLHLHAAAQARHADDARREGGVRVRPVSRTGLRGILSSLRSSIERLAWRPAHTEWGDYESDTNYSAAARDSKLAHLTSFLEEAVPRSVWDLGANVGTFSRLASERGIPTVAFDLDPAAVEKNYQRVRARGETHLLPLVMDLSNPSPAQGWDGVERASLHERGPADLVMALALIHHLAIGNNVPLEDVARFLRRLGRRVVVEFVPKSDSQVERMLASREDVFPGYHREGFEKAFEAHFALERRAAIADSDRVLYLFQAS